MHNGLRGKLVLQEVPTGQVEKQVIRLLLQFAKNASVEQLTNKIRRTPYTLSDDIEAEKAALFIEAFEKLGATAAFVPHAAAKPVAEPFAPFESEPRSFMPPASVSNQSTYSRSLQPPSPKTSVRNLVLFLIFILLLLSFGFLAWQLWPFLKGQIQGLLSYLKQLF